MRRSSRGNRRSRRTGRRSSRGTYQKRYSSRISRKRSSPKRRSRRSARGKMTHRPRRYRAASEAETRIHDFLISAYDYHRTLETNDPQKTQKMVHFVIRNLPAAWFAYQGMGYYLQNINDGPDVTSGATLLQSVFHIKETITWPQIPGGGNAPMSHDQLDAYKQMLGNKPYAIPLAIQMQTFLKDVEMEDKLEWNTAKCLQWDCKYDSNGDILCTNVHDPKQLHRFVLGNHRPNVPLDLRQGSELSDDSTPPSLQRNDSILSEALLGSQSARDVFGMYTPEATRMPRSSSPTGSTVIPGSATLTTPKPVKLVSQNTGTGALSLQDASKMSMPYA